MKQTDNERYVVAIFVSGRVNALARLDIQLWQNGDHLAQEWADMGVKRGAGLRRELVLDGIWEGAGRTRHDVGSFGEAAR